MAHVTDGVKAHVLVEVPLEEEFSSDLLVTAFDGDYGGCNYWIQFIELEADGNNWKTVYVKTIVEDDESEESDEEETHAINSLTLAKGISEILSEPRRWGKVHSDLRKAFLEQDGGGIDSAMIDAIVQLGCFGEIRYA